MNFLKSLFSNKDKPSSNKEAELQWRVQRNIAEDSCSLRHTTSIPKRKHPLRSLKKQGPKMPQFDLLKESGSLPNHLVQINKVQVMTQPMEIDFGLLVGLINPTHTVKNLLPADCFHVPIGPEEEIASPRLLRKGSLDTLIVSWSERGCQQGLWEELIESGSRLLVCADSWRAVKKIIVTVQQILLLKHKDKYLDQLGNQLITNLYQLKNQFFLHFQPSSALVDFLAKKHPFFQSPELTLRLTKTVTVEEYHQFRKGKSQTCPLDKHIKLLKDQMEKELILKSLEETLITTLVEEKLKEEEYVPYIIEQEVEDLETQYYKRESQKQTRQSGSRRPEHSDLYYFIEEHSSEDDNNDHEEEGEDSKEFSQLSRPLARSNSQNLKHHFEQLEADDEFFTKY